jgi:hypothetical protein
MIVSEFLQSSQLLPRSPLRSPNRRAAKGSQGQPRAAKGSQGQDAPFPHLDQPPTAQRQPKGRQGPKPDASSSDKPPPPQKSAAQKQPSAKPPAGSVKPAKCRSNRPLPTTCRLLLLLHRRQRAFPCTFRLCIISLRGKRSTA